MDNNFSAQVKEIISFSREEALRLGNDFIGTEHLLLGLIREGDNTAVRILKSFNVDLYELRKEIELAVKDKTGKNIANINSLPLTKQAEKVIREGLTIDTEFRAIMRQLITYMMEDPRTISTALDIVWIAKAIERVGDHSENIAEQVIYIVNGTDVRHTAGPPTMAEGDV